MYSGREFRVTKKDSEDMRDWEVIFDESTVAYNMVKDMVINPPSECDYCPCDHIVNPDYNPNRECDELCIFDPKLKENFVKFCLNHIEKKKQYSVIEGILHMIILFEELERYEDCIVLKNIKDSILLDLQRVI